MSEAKDRLLAQMKDAEGAVYALISGFTKEPYVECDKETYDDKVFVYLSEDAFRFLRRWKLSNGPVMVH